MCKCVNIAAVAHRVHDWLPVTRTRFLEGNWNSITTYSVNRHGFPSQHLSQRLVLRMDTEKAVVFAQQRHAFNEAG